MSKEYLFFIPLMIVLYLTKTIKGYDELKKDRIFSTIKLILNSIQCNITRNSFSLNYPKYQIYFSNFKIINPFEREIKINIINSNIYSIQDLIITFIYNNNIVFDSNNNHAKLEDSLKIFEIKFKEVVFFKNNNFLYFNNTIVDSIFIPKKSKINNLRYFKDFNEGIIKPIFSETNEYYDLNVILTNIFDEMFKNRILNIFEKINLYYYDLNKILENSKNIIFYFSLFLLYLLSFKRINLIYYFLNERKWISFINSDIYYPYNSKYVFINTIELSKDKIIIESNILYVRYLKFNGRFYFYNGDFIEFNAYLRDNVSLYLYKNMISFTNKYRPFKVKIIDKSIIDDENNYEYAFNKEFLTLLDYKCEQYYKELDK